MTRSNSRVTNDGYQGPENIEEIYSNTTGSGISMLPGGEQGPSQGPNTPIKNYGGRYMPDGSQPTGYRHGAAYNLLKKPPCGSFWV